MKTITLALVLILSSIPASVQSQPAAGVVNINTASASQIMLLPGIGVRTAQRIIEGRPYANTQELTLVRGIGEGPMFIHIRAYVVVSGPTTMCSKVRSSKHRHGKGNGS